MNLQTEKQFQFVLTANDSAALYFEHDTNLLALISHFPATGPANLTVQLNISASAPDLMTGN